MIINETQANETLYSLNHNSLNCLGGCGSGFGYFVILGVVACVVALIGVFYFSFPHFGGKSNTL